MNPREREHATLSFQKPEDRGTVEETFFPWHLALNRWKKEGLPSHIADEIYQPIESKEDFYIQTVLTKGLPNYEQFLGFDPVFRISFILPFYCYETKIIKETETMLIRQESDGWIKEHHKNSDMVKEIKPPITNGDDWKQLKQKAYEELDKYYTDENIRRMLEPLKEKHENGEFSLRMNITGFFWTPRTLFGIEEHLYAFYDYPEIMHDMNTFILDVYMKYLSKVLDILPVDVIYIMEDLSGGTGPMLSVHHFNEFLGQYYKKLTPMLKEKGVRHIFVDTDGDFNELIPHFIDAGIEGFLPMDVNAGMDIVKVREKYPTLKFIGGFNKLKIAEGKEAIDEEFQRILPVIRRGGYIPGCDHQVAPSTSFADYQYYIKRLHEVMREAGKDIDTY